ncbi:hypothetical protein Q6247_27325, partial [Klebsiella pneumoniae]
TCNNLFFEKKIFQFIYAGYFQGAQGHKEDSPFDKSIGGRWLDISSNNVRRSSNSVLIYF